MSTLTPGRAGKVGIASSSPSPALSPSVKARKEREAAAVAEWQNRRLYILPLDKGGKKIEDRSQWPEGVPKSTSWGRMRSNRPVPGVGRNLLRQHPDLDPNRQKPLSERTESTPPPRIGKEARFPNPITTTGAIPMNTPAFVYVGLKRDGRVKIGMSTRPEERCKELGLRMLLAHPVKTSAAKAVETDALRRLGVRAGEGEYVLCAPTVATAAVFAARGAVARVMHADPELSPDEARQYRIAVAQTPKDAAVENGAKHA